MIYAPTHINELFEAVDARSHRAVAGELEAPELQISDIRRILAENTQAELASLSFREKLEILGSIPDAERASPEMRTVRFDIGSHVTEVLRCEIERRLQPKVWELAFYHYDNRMLEIIVEAGELAAELVGTPALRCMKIDDLDAYAAVVTGILDRGDLPEFGELDAMLNRGCNFFSPLDLCLEDNQWGDPVGISEESVGRSAKEIRSWFGMLADLQSLHMKQTEEFRRLLSLELVTSSPRP